MQLDPVYFEDTSVHYFVPQPPIRESYIYYPISVGYLDCKPGYQVQQSIVSSYMLIAVLTGSLTFQTRRSKGIARAGQVLLLDCNSPHSYAALGKCSFTFVYFSGANSREIYENIESGGGNLFRTPSPSIIHEVIGEILNAISENKSMSEAHASFLVYSMLMNLLELSGASTVGTLANPVVESAIDFIQSHLTEKLSVENIAANVGYSASYFSHVFTQEIGLSPYQYVVRSRMERAQMLLKTTRHSVQEIAFQCGFNSAANFCYTFRRMTGISPQEYKRRFLQHSNT